MKITSDDFNRDLSRYISSRRKLGKPFHVQVYDAIKQTKKRLTYIKPSKAEEKEEEPLEIEVESEEPEEIKEEYEEIEEEIKKEKKPFWSFFTNIFKTEPKEVAEEIPEEKEETEELEEEYKDLEEMEEDVEELEGEIEEKKESVFRRLFDIFKTEPKEEIIEEVREEYTLNEDVKDTLKILTNWLKQLPPEKLIKLKESDDFAKIKDVLKKYNLIK